MQSLEACLAEEASKGCYRDTVAVLSAFRGIGLITALTLACEVGEFRRFAHPRQLMAYLDLVSREHISGNRVVRGGITKAGNTHARKALVSASWKYATTPLCSVALRTWQQQVSAPVIRIAWKVQRRLYKRYYRLSQRRPRNVTNVAVARELVGLLWEALHIATATTAALAT